ncbi:protease modulator HflC [Brucepastera parasyntrophica]|uniref:protease modulator HflC n=1 Tax=Brucepastera parasyntrophica TaxID=2880008 RepID=UPI00210BBEF1|nr:protease modulator HflC [Brucepastera parasyntrophica]ULQ59704.1 protease modulator HflC [Brucepastera parasyntrophica]
MKGKVIRALIIIAIVLIVILMGNPFYVLKEGNQVVITRFGEIVNSTAEAGLHLKAPFIDTVITYPKKLMSFDGDSQRIPTKENQFIIVETTSRWKISDPVKFYEAVTTIEEAYLKLGDIIDSSVRTVITSSGLNDVVRNSNIINELQHSENFALGAEAEDVQLIQITGDKVIYETITRGRKALSAEMAAIAREKMPEFGIELLDIVPRQIKYSDELTGSVYSRMIKERNQIAQTFRSAGEGKKAEWLGKLENEKKTILSEAYSRAESIKGSADAEASRIYAESYSRDPEFYSFWKSIETYKTTLQGFDKILSTDMDFFRYLYSPAGR